MYSVRSCCTVSGMNILLSGPLVKTPELLCQSYYFIYSLCVSGGLPTIWWVEGLSQSFYGFSEVPRCVGTLRLISI